MTIFRILSYALLSSAFLLSQCKSSGQMNNSEYEYTNNLINESSPYLLQHAHNPVDWYPWGDKALNKAKSENKLLVISIGYAACHWCHVMEHESFEDTLVAKLMNESFVSIKVDREERPDIDDVYMTACSLITGQGGWPLNAVALPDGRPIWAGTYFPKEKWIDILNQFSKLKEENYDKLVEAAERIVEGLQQVDAVVDVKSDVEFKEEELLSIGSKFLQDMDYELGGRGIGQKFPMPNNYEFLLKFAHTYPESQAAEAINTTLTEMAKGGIYDQLEGGFARYSVDKYWKVPHFEKMLYDNAQLVSLYSQAYKYSNNPTYKTIVEETIGFIENNWKDDSGGFYSSYDADSEGVEGKFYVFTRDEIKAVLQDEQEADLFSKYYNVTDYGNWEESNILHIKTSDKDFVEANGLTMDELVEKRANWKRQLLQERNKRVFPGLDDKILTSWNALLIKGYIDAYQAFRVESYREKAISLWDFIEKNLLAKDGVTLKRNYKEGKSSINAFLDDYSISINALINLYQITFDEKYLSTADKLMQHVIIHFQDKNSSMFNFTSDLDPPLVARKSELSDNVIPGSNSITARNLHALGLLLYKDEYIDLAGQMLKNMKTSIVDSNQPNFYSNWCNLYFDQIHDPYEVAIMGPNHDGLRKEMMSQYHPNALYLGGNQEGSLKLLEDKLQEGEDFIYVCVQKSCKIPVQEAEKAMELMK